MPMNDFQYQRKRASAIIKASRSFLTIRKVTQLSGMAAAPNPPNITGPLSVYGDFNPGASSIVLTASHLIGRVVAGDTFEVDGRTLTASAAATADATNRVTVPLTADLTEAISNGAAAAPNWSADMRLAARATPFAQNYIDGQSILMRDLRVQVAALDLGTEPTVGWQIIMPDGDIRQVVSWQPGLVQNFPVFYFLQAR